MPYVPGGALPWLPAGVGEMPAERYIIFSDTAEAVQLLNESVKTGGGASFTAIWMSQILNRVDITRVYTLQRVLLYYANATQHSMLVDASGDGGASFPVSKTVTLLATTGGRIRMISVPLRVTGQDLRLRFQFTSNETPNIFGFTPVMVERGRLPYAS